MNSIRKKFYITYLLITASGAVGMREFASHFRELPLYHGIDIYAALLGIVYLVISATLLEYFIFMRINHINKELNEFKKNGYSTKKKIIDFSKKDELGQIVLNINEAMRQLDSGSEKLRHKNNLYLSLVEEPSIYVYRFKEDGTITFVNKSYAEMCGLSYKKMHGENIFNYLAEPEDFKNKLSFLNPIDTSLAISIDMPKILNQSAPKWIAWNASAVFDSTGKPKEYQVVGLNLHTTKSVGSSKSFEQDNIFLLTIDGKITYISNINDYENVVGQHFTECIHKDDIDAFLKSFEEVKKDKKSTISNTRMKKGKSFIVAQILIGASLDKENNVNSISIKMIDITDIDGAQARVVGAVSNMNRLLEEQTNYN